MPLVRDPRPHRHRMHGLSWLGQHDCAEEGEGMTRLERLRELRDTGSSRTTRSDVSIRRLSLRETCATYKRFLEWMAADPRRVLCGIVCNCGPHGEPLACAYTPNHSGGHSWAELPTFSNNEPRDQRPPPSPTFDVGESE